MENKSLTTPPAPETSAEALRAKEAFNFALFQHNPLAITVVDGSGRVMKSNLARRNAGDPLPELGAPLFAPDDGHSADMAAALARAMVERAVQSCSDVRLADCVYRYTIAPFPHGAIVLREDITAEKLALAQLIQAQKLAALGTLVSGIAHEISNPNSIMLLSAASLARLIDGLLPVLDAHRRRDGDFEVGDLTYDAVRRDIPELAASCRRAAQRIHALVTDLKSYARPDDRPAAVRLDVNVVARGAVELMGAAIRRATRRFTAVYADAVPAVRGSARRLEQVVINLLANACQALPDPGRAVALATGTAADGWVHIRVGDEGRGIPADCLARVTDPFFTTRQDDGGTGLGLSISQQIVQSMGGRLDIVSRSGEGTTVTILLPPAVEETA